MTRSESPSPIPKRRLPHLLEFLGLHLLLGTAIGVAFVSLVLLANTLGLKDLIATSSEPLLPVLLLYFFNVLTFSSVTMGIGIMRLRGISGDPGRQPVATAPLAALMIGS